MMPETSTLLSLHVVLVDIVEEIARAETKHPHYPSDPVRRAAIVCEEAGELIRAALDLTRIHSPLPLSGEELEDRMYTEATHTACTAIRCMVAINADRKERHATK